MKGEMLSEEVENLPLLTLLDETKSRAATFDLLGHA